MRQPPDKPITAEIAREVCQRQGLKAFVMGAIAPIGSHYAITLTAVDSQSGRTLTRVQADAAAKEEVLHALSLAASELREKLGESVLSLRKFDALLDVSTSSLEALRVYSLGRRERVKGNNSEAIPSFVMQSSWTPTLLPRIGHWPPHIPIAGSSIWHRNPPLRPMLSASMPANAKGCTLWRNTMGR